MTIGRAHRGAANATDATLLYQRMLYVLQRRGIEKAGWQTPVEFAKAVADPMVKPLVTELTSAYNEFRFGGNMAAAGRVARLLSQIEKA